MNPDGYEYTWTNDRNWQKNRVAHPGTFCFGTFINQNYPYKFSNAGINVCADNYPGEAELSEIESEFHVLTIEENQNKVKNLNSVTLLTILNKEFQK